MFDSLTYSQNNSVNLSLSAINTSAHHTPLWISLHLAPCVLVNTWTSSFFTFCKVSCTRVDFKPNTINVHYILSIRSESCSYRSKARSSQNNYKRLQDVTRCLILRFVETDYPWLRFGSGLKVHRGCPPWSNPDESWSNPSILSKTLMLGQYKGTNLCNLESVH